MPSFTFGRVLALAAAAGALSLSFTPAALAAPTETHAGAQDGAKTASPGKGQGTGAGRCHAPGQPPVPSEEGTLAYFQDAHEYSPREHADGHRGGIALLATVLDRIEAANENPATIFGGDMAGGSLFGGVYKGFPFVEAFNDLGVDAATFGQHDFDFGLQAALDPVNASEFPWIASNLAYKDGSVFLPGAVAGSVEAGELSVGVIGLTGSLQNSSANAELNQRPYLESTRAGVKLLQEQDVDVIVVSGQIDRAEGLELMAQVPEIQVLMREENSGSSPAEALELGKERLMVTGMGDYGVVAEIDIAKDLCGNIRTGAVLHDVDESVAEEPSWAAKAAFYEQDMEKRLDARIGTARGDFGRRAAGELAADAFRDYYQADLGWANGGGIRAEIDGGDLSLRDLHTVFPFGNRAMLIEVTGQQLIEGLNQGADSSPGGYGGFPRVSGFTYTYSESDPAGQRIGEVLLQDGTPLDPGATYSLAITNYVATNGGDGVTAFLNAPIAVSADEGTADVSALWAYVQKLGTVTPNDIPRATVLP
ncbi:5'-nucleotidase C-terminal domain-containing protein [Paeniglutamicibacter sulfureus]|uniref:bifunctional metallophosphatase/5'-nucleotidase n=1 Tax=Paeniglutamicibacter sulfureus TaxID=43666 RepID=UPI002664F96C|nr:5'-nucleotidase C-terminal domain-containing protein [Paeniglutamicibacter sulfureus]MDO2935464.1 5'-nucleotidase C-terminal domain-containing protein [Paeniglutamicibacter sulfureus]